MVDTAEVAPRHTPLLDTDQGRDIVLDMILSTVRQSMRLDSSASS
jgi:hypothetical protein